MSWRNSQKNYMQVSGNKEMHYIFLETQCNMWSWSVTVMSWFLWNFLCYKHVSSYYYLRMRIRANVENQFRMYFKQIIMLKHCTVPLDPNFWIINGVNIVELHEYSVLIINYMQHCHISWEEYVWSFPHFLHSVTFSLFRSWSWRKKELLHLMPFAAKSKRVC